MEHIIWLLLFFLHLPLLSVHWKKWKCFSELAGERKKKYKKLYRKLLMNVDWTSIVCIECLILSIVHK